MRILILKDIVSPYRVPLFNALAEREGVELRVVVARRTDPRRDYRFHESEFRFASSVLPGIELHRGMRWIVFNRGLGTVLRDFRPDVLVVGGWAQPVFWQAMRWARRRHVPLVLWVESTVRDSRSGSRLLEAAKRLAVRSAAGFLVPGRASASYVESLGVPRERIAIAPNAVDLGLFREEVLAQRARRGELRAELGLDACAFLCVSRLSREKGVDVLARAFAGVPGHLVVAGDGPESRAIRAAAPAGTRFLGSVPREELPRWYAAVDVFVQPSRSETWGMAMTEAAVAGLPLVSSEAPGAAWDLIEQGVSGYRVPVEDETALRAILQRIAGDPDWRTNAARRTLELVATHTPDAWADAVTVLAGSFAGRDRRQSRLG